jgi:hypothetical protein
MTYILITERFRKQLKKLKRHLTEPDVVRDVQRFILNGLSKGETYLEAHTVGTLHLEVVKLRLCVYQVNFRYLVGIVNEREVLPIIIDLKKGRYGQNLSFRADKRTVKAIESAFQGVVWDYLHHTDEQPTLTAYMVDEEGTI